MDLTIPEGISAFYLKVGEVGSFLKNYDEDVFLIVDSASDLEKISQENIEIPEVNIGIIHMAIGKKALTAQVAVDDKDLKIFEDFSKRGADVYVRLSPYSQKMEINSLFDKIDK